MSKKIVIAKVLTSHGVKGFVKLESYMEKPKDIFNYSNVLYDKHNKQFKIKFIGTIKPNVFITQIDGISSPEVAKSWRNTELYIDINLLPKIDDEFYYNELIGMEVVSSNNNSRGKIIGIDDYGAGTVVEIKDEIEGTTFTYTVLGPWESDPDKNIISVTAPAIREIYGAKAGDRLKFNMNGDNKDWTIVSISKYTV